MHEKYDLKIMGCREPLTIESVANVTDMTVEQVLEIIKNRKRNMIDIGFITDIVVVEEGMLDVYSNYKKPMGKQLRTAISKMITNGVAKEPPVKKLKRYKFIIEGQEYTTAQILIRLKVSAPTIIAPAKAFSSFDFKGLHIDVKEEYCKHQTFNYTRDGNTFFNGSIMEISEAAGIKSYSIYQRVKTVREAYVFDNLIIYNGTFKDALEYIVQYGYDSNRYHFGTFNALYNKFNYDKTLANVQKELNDNKIYREKDKTIIHS